MKNFFETREQIRFDDGVAIGREEGREEGQITAWCAAVKKMMLNLKMTLEASLDWLEIPAKFRPAVIKAVGIA